MTRKNPKPDEGPMLEDARASLERTRAAQTRVDAARSELIEKGRQHADEVLLSHVAPAIYKATQKALTQVTFPLDAWEIRSIDPSRCRFNAFTIRLRRQLRELGYKVDYYDRAMGATRSDPPVLEISWSRADG